MKKIYNYKESIKSHFGYNFLFFTLSMLVGILGIYLSKNLISVCKSAICNKSIVQIIANSDFILIAGLSLVLFYYLTYRYSKKWLTTVDTTQRIKVVLVEVILTLLGVTLFSIISFFGIIFVYQLI